jgi:hypothetical protein
VRSQIRRGPNLAGWFRNLFQSHGYTT